MFKYELPNLELLKVDTGNVSTPENDYLLRQLSSLLTQKNNLHGRRVGKAKDAIAPGDYVTKRQLNGTLFGTLALRPQPSNVAPGTTYFATDRNVTYQMRNGHWYYYSGIQNVTLNPNTKPSPSVLYDTGYMIYATDFDWYFRWNLVTWEKLNGVSRYIQGFELAPTKVGWGLCDGTTYAYAKDDGSLSTVVSPNLTGVSKFVEFGGSYSASVAAVAPTISGSTGSDGAHTHTTTATGNVTGKLPDHTHGVSFTSGTGNLTLSGSVGTGITGTVTQSFPDCSDVVEGDLELGISVVNCGATYDLFANLNDGTVSFGSDGTHTHAVEGNTAGVNEGEIDLVDLAFTGDSVTSSSNDAHTHTGSSLTVTDTARPIAVRLIPYIRL